MTFYERTKNAFAGMLGACVAVVIMVYVARLLGVYPKTIPDNVSAMLWAAIIGSYLGASGGSSAQ